MLFEQKIKYLDYYEAGERIRGAGFIRMECWGETCKVVIQVAGVFEEASGAHPVMITFGESQVELGEIRLERGKGRAEIRDLWCADVSGGRGEIRIPVTEAEKVLIPLGNGRELRAILRIMPEIPRDGGEDLRQEAEERELEGWESEEREAEGRETSEKEAEGWETNGKGTEEVERTGQATEGEDSKGEATKEMARDERERKGQETDGREQEVKAAEVQPRFTAEASLKPGKWDQLGAIYPRISPFGDARRYLQISPGDFVILKDRSYRMVNNSFLLHGYFTYRHLILHRMRRNGEMIYYVGVPGVYFEKEKEVAVLFGFESFEGAEEPAREGDFGYYMMRVEL